MLKTSMSDYEKSSAVTYPSYFINRQSIHKTNCMQKIKKKSLNAGSNVSVTEIYTKPLKAVVQLKSRCLLMKPTHVDVIEAKEIYSQLSFERYKRKLMLHKLSPSV